MILLSELYKPEDRFVIDESSHSNLVFLHYKLNLIRFYCGEPLTINRGFSTKEEQIAIYAKIGKPPALGSQHLIGAAADVADPDGTLKKWILEHLDFIEGQMLFLEDFDATPTWLHIQLYPYGSWQSGKSHFFKP